MSQPTITQQDVDELILWMKRHLPSFEVCYKDESALQKLIGRLVAPINPRYMTGYTTVMFGKVYFPSRRQVELWGCHQMYVTLRHEFIHLMDAKRFPLWFEFSYLFCFPVVFTMRGFWEWRGYTQDLIVEFEQTGDIADTSCDWIAAHFFGSDYGWMHPFPKNMKKIMRRTKQRILDGSLRGTYPYKKLDETE